MRIAAASELTATPATPAPVRRPAPRVSAADNGVAIAGEWTPTGWSQPWHRDVRRSIAAGGETARVLAYLLSAVEPMVPRIVRGVDGWGDDRTEDAAQTVVFRRALRSPIESAQQAWRRYTELMLSDGICVWVEVQPDLWGLPDGQTWPDVSWVPVAVSAVIEKQGETVVTLPGGVTLTWPKQTQPTVVVSGNWDPRSPREVRSELRGLAAVQACVVDGVAALNAMVGRSAVQRHLIQVPDAYRRVTAPDGEWEELSVAQLLQDREVERARAIVTSKGLDARVQPPLFASFSEGDVSHILTHPSLDGGVVEALRYFDERLAVASSVPSSVLRGDEPKYSNRAVDATEFAVTEAGQLASMLEGAVTQLVARICGVAFELWLDPTAMIAQTVAAVNDTPISAATRPILTDAQVAGLGSWQEQLLETARQAGESIDKAMAEQITPQQRTSLIRRWGEVFAGLLASLRWVRTGNTGDAPQPSAFDRLVADQVVGGIVADTGTVIAEAGTPGGVGTVVDRLLIGLTGDRSPIRSPLVQQMFPELSPVTPGDVTWEWRRNDPGDPGREPFEGHRLDGKQWQESDPNGPGGFNVDESRPARVGDHKHCQCTQHLVSVGDVPLP